MIRAVYTLLSIVFMHGKFILMSTVLLVYVSSKISIIQVRGLERFFMGSAACGGADAG
jgi:hypothetical protein